MAVSQTNVLAGALLDTAEILSENTLKKKVQQIKYQQGYIYTPHVFQSIKIFIP